VRQPRIQPTYVDRQAKSFLPPAAEHEATSVDLVHLLGGICDDRGMVRTGRRASVLADLLKGGGLVVDVTPPSAPRIDDLQPWMAEDLFDLYRTLGGKLDRPALRPGAWDLSLDGVLIELDEELHFNRHRETTLRRPWAAALPWTAPYLDMCRAREVECLRAARWGQRWTSQSSVRMFGGGGQPGDISSDAGAPRWKQRALYDAVKDAIAAQDEDTKVARLSVYDEVSGRLLGDVLEVRAPLDLDELLAVLASRTS